MFTSYIGNIAKVTSVIIHDDPWYPLSSDDSDATDDQVVDPTFKCSSIRESDTDDIESDNECLPKSNRGENHQILCAFKVESMP